MSPRRLLGIKGSRPGSGQIHLFITNHRLTGGRTGREVAERLLISRPAGAVSTRTGRAAEDHRRSARRGGYSERHQPATPRMMTRASVRLRASASTAARPVGGAPILLAGTPLVHCSTGRVVLAGRSCLEGEYGRERPARVDAMGNADFWRSLKNEFTRLAEYEHRAVPDPADRRRLTAYGDYTGASDAEGRWTLSDGVTADFRLLFQEAAIKAAFVLKPRAGAKPLEFWLHSLAQFLNDHENAHPDRGHLGVWGDRGGVIRDVPAASAIYCSDLLKKYAIDKAAVRSPGGKPVDAARARHAVENAVGLPASTRHLGKAAVRRPRRWEDVKLDFLSDERIQVWIGGDPQTYNYAEFGCADRRTGGPNTAWKMLQVLAASHGVIPATSRTAVRDWPAMEKQLQRLRAVLRQHFGLTDDPLPFRRNEGYRLRLQIGRALSLDK